MRLLDRVAYVNHDIDDAAARRRARRVATCRASRSPCSARRARSGSTRSCTTSSSAPSAAGDIVQGAEAGRGDGRAARLHVRARLPGPAARAEHRKIERVVRALFDHYCEHPGEIPPLDPDADLATPRDRLPRRHDRPLLHPPFEALTRPARLPLERSPMPRYTDDSKEKVRDAVDMIALVSARTELRRAGVNSYFGRCPFHEERTGSFHVRPEEKHYHCFGCQMSGDPFRFVMETEGLDFVGAMESLAERFGVTLEVADEDPLAKARRERRDRLALAARPRGRLLRALPVGGRRGARRARVPRAARAGARRR